MKIKNFKDYNKTNNEYIKKDINKFIDQNKKFKKYTYSNRVGKKPLKRNYFNSKTRFPDNDNIPVPHRENKFIKKNMKNMKNIETNFKKFKMFETGEWPRNVDLDYIENNPEIETEETLWIEKLRDDLIEIEKKLNNQITNSADYNKPLIVNDKQYNLIIEDIKGFDKYQGPYAIINLNDDRYNVWTINDDELYFVSFCDKENFKGNKYDIIEHIQEIY